MNKASELIKTIDEMLRHAHIGFNNGINKEIGSSIQDKLSPTPDKSAKTILINKLQKVEDTKFMGMNSGFDGRAKQHVAKIRAAYSANKRLPPVLTYKLPTSTSDREEFENRHSIKLNPNATHLLVDGHHRVAAAKAAGKSSILHHEVNSVSFE